MMLHALLYHRIQDPATVHAGLAPDLISASAAMFDRQMRHVARTYQPIGALELRAALAGRHTLPPRAVLVTFDDGYRDFMQLAWPILREHGIPAVLFVVTEFVSAPDRIFWWDALWQMISRTRRDRIVLPERTLVLDGGEPSTVWHTAAEMLKQLTPAQRRSTLGALAAQLGVVAEPTRAVLSWAELRNLQRDGVTVAPHSQTHELLDQVDATALRGEVQGSRDDVAREFGTCEPLFAYPNGNFNSAVMCALRAAGFEAAFTTMHGASVLGYGDPLALRREAGSSSLLRLALKLTGPIAALRNHQDRLPAYAEGEPTRR